ncbi:MAG: tetratricopeptide repeat protein [Anaerolineaceae bacterium]|nr:tetratricopeptide repeat protein [Anaerolineaceae bacterium]
MSQNIKKAIQLRKDKKYNESSELLKQLVDQNPESAELNYQFACSLDILGQEKNAIEYYKKAIALGLDGDDLLRAFVGLGSSYRTIGEYEKSKEILSAGLNAFPRHHGLLTFYAIALYNLREYKESTEILLSLLAETTSDQSIKDYDEAIRFYAKNLDETC